LRIKQSNSIVKLLYRTWQHVRPRRRRQFFLILALIIFVSFLDVITIGALIPFLGALTAPERIFEHSFAQPFIHILGLVRPSQILMPITLIFVVAALLAGAMRLMLLWTSTRFVSEIGTDFSLDIYRRCIYQPYSVHVSRNSSEVITGVTDKAYFLVSSAIQPILTLLGAGVLLVAVLLTLAMINPIVALSVFGGFSLFYGAIAWVTRARLASESEQVSKKQIQVLKALQEGFGGIRDILIDGTQPSYCDIYRSADRPLRRSMANIAIIGACPRYIIEPLGIITIAGVAYVMTAGTAVTNNSAIPLLGALVLGAQKLLPVLQQGYGAWSAMKGGQASLHDALALLDQPLPDYLEGPPRPVTFRNNIQLKNIFFSYAPESAPILRGLDLTIRKGARVGFVGASGSGKSTLLDILMGLLFPTRGVMKVDNQIITLENHRAWQMRIAHVPQVVFLSDTTIEENIAFGLPKDLIDHERLREAARKAQISETIESWPAKYGTLVGERGVQLSGGQRQRIGIARALYKKVDVIIFDEATSALDGETEQAVMQAIENLGDDLTILIVAHRLTTLRNCSQIVELLDGKIKRCGSYGAT
jgi:ABC-type multidrug transport system fused ATPase/permease subunit